MRWLADSTRQSCKSAIDYILWLQLQVNAKSLLSSEIYGAHIVDPDSYGNTS